MVDSIGHIVSFVNDLGYRSARRCCTSFKSSIIHDLDQLFKALLPSRSFLLHVHTKKRKHIPGIYETITCCWDTPSQPSVLGLAHDRQGMLLRISKFRARPKTAANVNVCTSLWQLCTTCPMPYAVPFRGRCENYSVLVGYDIRPGVAFLSARRCPGIQSRCPGIQFAPLWL